MCFESEIEKEVNDLSEKIDELFDEYKEEHLMPENVLQKLFSLREKLGKLMGWV